MRYKGLDGIRAIGIMLVVLVHANTAGYVPWAKSLIWHLYPGPTTIFFVVSGFVVTSTLLKKGDFRTMWRNRTLRLMPPLTAFLSVVMLLKLANPSDIWLIPIANYATLDWSIGHVWSLATEEQFYILWCIILILFPRKAWIWMVTVVVIVPVIRLFAEPSHTALHIRGDALAWGCLAAFIQQRNFQLPWKSMAYMSGIIYVVQSFSTALFHTMSPILLPVTVMLGLLAVINNQEWWVTKVLNLKPFILIGSMTYSIYLWQQIFFDPAHPVSPIVIFLGLPTAVLISYYGIEKQVIGWRQRRDLAKREMIPI